MKFYLVGTYTGSFREGKRDGNGQFTWINGDQYLGEWKDDKMNGKGIYTFSDGTCYEGTFKDDEMISVTKKYKK